MNVVHLAGVSEVMLATSRMCVCGYVVLLNLRAVALHHISYASLSEYDNGRLDPRRRPPINMSYCSRIRQTETIKTMLYFSYGHLEQGAHVELALSPVLNVILRYI